jgi:Nif-specific regulatory protein
LVVSKGEELRFPYFASRNVAEENNLFPFFVTDFPLSRINIIKLNEKRFLGIVTFPMNTIEEFQRSKDKMAVFTNDQDRIIGYNNLFALKFNQKDPKAFLGKKLTDILVFNRSPFAVPAIVSELKLRTLIHWQAGKSDFPFKPADNNSRLTPVKDGLLWENTSDSYHAFLQFKKPLSVDDHHFTIHIEFQPKQGHFPFIILRGIKRPDSGFPDIFGYTLTFPPDGNKSAFKKTGVFMTYYTMPDIVPDEVHSLEIRKTGNVFSFYFNSRQFGQWHEQSPFLLKSDNLFYLFLRLGQSLVLRSVQIKQAPIRQSQDTLQQESLTAQLRERPGAYQFNVNMVQGALADANYVMYQFEDVTAFKNNIRHLQEERNKFAAMVSQDRTFIGQSLAIQNIKNQIQTVAGQNLSILIEGETGTGKELLAQCIHHASPRKNGPLIKIDCSTIPQELMESELFGHEKGAFTGATDSHTGRFEQAQGGTVFLDEIANLSPAIQAKLLGVLQDFRIQRVGGTKSIPLDVRLVCASNIPLKEWIGTGKFRKDLYYRINQFRFEIPPLRTRQEDIPLIAERFIREANAVYNKSVKGLEPSAVKKIYYGAWPGNVRELRNVIFKAVLFCEGERISETELDLEDTRKAHPDKPKGVPGKRGGERTKCPLNKEHVIDGLKSAKGNVRKAAGSLNISRGMIYKLIRKFRIEPESFRA